MPSRSTIRWLLIPGLSLGILALSALLSYWLTRPIHLAPPPAEAPAPTEDAAPAGPEPSPPHLTPPVVPPPAFPSPQSATPVLPAPGQPDPRRVVEAKPVIESMTGRIDSGDVHRAIQAVTPLVQQCFEDAAQRNRGPQVVRLRFTVEAKDGAGQMGGGELLESTIPDPMVQACVVDSLLDARFPPPPDGGKATVVYPFEFRAPPEAGR
jgi:hypothetical protein